MEAYKDYIYRAFVMAVDKLKPVRVEVYDLLPKVCLHNFCNGMLLYDKSPIAYFTNIRLPFSLTEE